MKQKWGGSRWFRGDTRGAGKRTDMRKCILKVRLPNLQVGSRT